MTFLAYCGAAISVAAGVAGFLFPVPVSRVIGLGLPSSLARSEFRATYGGLFVGAGLAVILLASSDAALVLGAAWLGAGVARVLSILIDRALSRENLAGVLIEVAVGAALVLGR